MPHSSLLFALLLLGGCAIARIEPSSRSEVAVVSQARDERHTAFSRFRLRADQVLVPSRADGVEEFCSTAPSWFGESTRPRRACFRDTDGAGRFNLAFLLTEERSARIAVNIPYRVQPFPCSSGCPVSNADLTSVSDPQLLASHSIAPPDLRPYVALAISEPLALDAAAGRTANPGATAEAARLAARDVLDRRAVSICSASNPGGAAGMFGIIGAIATIAGTRSEQQCMDEYMRTGAMPIPPAPPPPPQ